MGVQVHLRPRVGEEHPQLGGGGNQEVVKKTQSQTEYTHLEEVKLKQLILVDKFAFYF